MNWDFLLSRAAERSLRSIPTKDRQQINAALNRMKAEPLGGSLTALKGECYGLFRRDVGLWRIIFELDVEKRLVLLHDSLRRPSMKY